MQLKTGANLFVLVVFSLFVMGGCTPDVVAPGLIDEDVTVDGGVDVGQDAGGKVDDDTGDTSSKCAEACTGDTSVCDEVSGQCVACTDSSHCAAHPGTTHAGECSAVNTCVYNGHVLEGDDINVVFVSATGVDGNEGLTPDKPKATISAGIAAAIESERAFVVVGAGEYDEVVTLKDGVSIYGGYDAVDWSRDVQEHKTIIKAGDADAYNGDDNAYKTVVANGLAGGEGAVVLSGLVVEGVDADTVNKGASTFAVWALNSKGLAIEDSEVVGGKGAVGKDAEDGGGSCERLLGGAGGKADDSVLTADGPCSTGELEWAKSGRNGETGSSGGKGGAHICFATRPNDVVNKDGEAGKSVIADVSNGANGKPADDEKWGALTDSGEWLAAEGASADAGDPGGGGGGGGAGGNYQADSDSDVYLGGAGGKGGDGGCGGLAGDNGGAGGSSFGVAVIKGELRVLNTTIKLGAGGDGGDGGAGGKGGAGDLGLPGARGQYNSSNNTIIAGKGGDGGNGGNGGAGGDGAGGSGGDVVGLVLAHRAKLEESGLSFGGEAKVGAGGAGGGSDGKEGRKGLSAGLKDLDE